MKFADIPAQYHIKERLVTLADTDRIPHAILLEGRAGIGKFLLARAFAQYLHCTHRIDGDSCGTCPSCIQHQSLNHIDTHYVFPILKAKSPSAISDDLFSEWKDYLRESPFMDFNVWLKYLGNDNGKPAIYVNESIELIRKLNFTSHNSRYKVVLLWLPERMNDECANKLLKLIEEPPADTLFILSSDNSAEILPTIYSRLQRIEVPPIDETDIESYLNYNLKIDRNTAHDAAHLSNGSITTAISLAVTSDKKSEYFEFFVNLMRLAYQRKIFDLRAWAEAVSKQGRERLSEFLTYCERMIGENFIFNLQDDRLTYLASAESAFSKNFARFISEKNVEKLRQIFIDARIDINANGNAKIIMFDVAVKTILLLK